MALHAYDLSAGLFIRGLTNLGSQLAKAEAHVAASGRDANELLEAQLATDRAGVAGLPGPPHDVHRYLLADQVHWAAEGARLATARLLGERPARVPPTEGPRSIADLRQHIDATIAYLREIAPGDLESGLDRTIELEHPRGTLRSTGKQFLIAYAIPHFFYHLTACYGIMRNEGVPLTMGDVLGNWPAS